VQRYKQGAAAFRFLFGGIAIASSRSLVKFNTYPAFLRLTSHWLLSHQHSLSNHCIPVLHVVDPCALQLILFTAVESMLKWLLLLGRCPEILCSWGREHAEMAFASWQVSGLWSICCVVLSSTLVHLDLNRLPEHEREQPLFIPPIQRRIYIATCPMHTLHDTLSCIAFECTFLVSTEHPTTTCTTSRMPF
jgi:hypothetical protein